jgi:nucleotide-binding universal stress UspA family protein
MDKKRIKIVVSIDFQPQSLVALEKTYELARFIKAELVLIYVIEEGDFLSSLFRSKEEVEGMLTEARNRLDKIVADARDKSGLEITSVVERGKVYEKIIELSRKVHARFIVMGKNGTNVGFRKILGSNTTHVVGEATCPVITVKGELRNLGYKHIVLPLDLRKKTREQLFNAISFGLHFDSTIHMVSVLMGGVPFEKSRIYRKMRRIQRILSENGVNSTIQLYRRMETPIQIVIIDYAHHVNADLIMIMTHQETSTSDNYIGVVAHQIINESDIPVLSLTLAAARDRENLLTPVFDPFRLWK